MILFNYVSFHLRKWILNELAVTDKNYSVSQRQCQDLKPELAGTTTQEWSRLFVAYLSHPK